MSFFLFPEEGESFFSAGRFEEFSWHVGEKNRCARQRISTRVDRVHFDFFDCSSISFKISTTRCKSWNRATPSGYDFNEFYSRSIFNFVIEQNMKFLPFLGRTLKITYMLGSSAKLIHNYKRILARERRFFRSRYRGKNFSIFLKNRNQKEARAYFNS